jgi:hypothetical protein
MITTFIITIVSLLLGYFLGRGVVTKDTYREIKKEVEHRVLPQFKQPSGVIQRPSAKRIYDIQHPQVEEEKEEMSKLFDKDGQINVEPLTRVTP